ncbi:MAG TPA: alpha/beta hydrolase [Rhizomicrobium sp.]|nr:alpha/beta hydrolase [Rhizomicrobium sp.]
MKAKAPPAPDGANRTKPPDGAKQIKPPDSAKQKSKKAPVVMIHGAFAGPWSWDEFAAKFRDAGYKVHAPSLRHHDGEKPPASLGQTSLTDYADDLETLLEELDAPPILIGHSMGGLLAQMLAARCDVRALVLLAPSAPWGVPPSTLFEIASAQSMLLNVGFWNSVLKPDQHIAGRNSLDRLPQARRDALFARFVPESGRAAFEIMHWGLDMRRASEVDASKVDCPLLLIAGGEDRVNPPGTVERIAALYGGRAQYEKFSGMSHWLVAEPGWDKVAARALEWLGKLD